MATNKAAIMETELKAVIVSINTKYIHSAAAPWYLLAGVRRHSALAHDIIVHEANLKHKDEDIAGAVLATSPDIAAFSCYIWNIERVKDIVSALKSRCPGIKIILGGPEVSYNAAEVMDALPGADYIISGEGERPFALLLDCLGTGGQIPEDCGITRREGDRVIVQPLYATGLEPPSPFTEEYLRTLRGRIAYLETSRGCPFSCAFCLSGRGEGVRFFDMDRVKREIGLLRDSGARIIKLVDRTFNCDPKRALEIMKHIVSVSGGEGPSFHLEVGADLFDEGILSLLESAPKGLFQIEAGIQSFNGKTLEAIDRKTDTVKAINNLSRIISGGKVHVHTDLIAGLPHEDMDSFADSFGQAFSMRPHQLQLGFLKMLHGAMLRREAGGLGYEYSENPAYEIISSPCMTKEELDRLRLAEDALQRLYNSRRFLHTVEYVLSAVKCGALELFEGAGKAAGNCGGISLDAYTALMLRHFSSLPGVDGGRLRDWMVCDRLRADPSGRLPDCLRVSDPLLGRVKRAAKERGGRLGVALLYSGGVRVACADYGGLDRVDGRWRLDILELSEFL